MKIAIHMEGERVLGVVAKGAPADLEVVAFEYSNREKPGAVRHEVIGRPDLESWITKQRVGVQDAAKSALEINKIFS